MVPSELFTSKKTHILKLRCNFIQSGGGIYVHNSDRYIRMWTHIDQC